MSKQHPVNIEQQTTPHLTSQWRFSTRFSARFNPRFHLQGGGGGESYQLGVFYLNYCFFVFATDYVYAAIYDLTINVTTNVGVHVAIFFVIFTFIDAFVSSYWLCFARPCCVSYVFNGITNRQCVFYAGPKWTRKVKNSSSAMNYYQLKRKTLFNINITVSELQANIWTQPKTQTQTQTLFSK